VAQVIRSRWFGRVAYNAAWVRFIIDALFKIVEQYMEQHCGCHEEQGKGLTLREKKLGYTVQLLREHFLAPFKILYMLDPTQADRFKRRNQGKGCCTSNKITIPLEEQSQTEKWLAEMLSPAWLASHLDGILSLCAERHANILAKGK
jgi:hypothetical protein